jgi:hypothetical protein
MTVLERHTRTRSHYGFVPYLLVGALSVAIGVGVGLNVGSVADGVFESVPQQAMVERGAEVGEHLESIWATGLAQQQALGEARILEHRIDTGLIQGELIRAEMAPLRAMHMRGEAVADHLDSLINTGLIQQELIRG